MFTSHGTEQVLVYRVVLNCSLLFLFAHTCPPDQYLRGTAPR